MCENKKFYVTTPIYYPSRKFTLGNCYTTVICDDCDYVTTALHSAFGHAYGDAEEKQSPTCTVDGIKISICATCGDVKEETIPAPGHNYSEEITTAATCTAAGTSTCSNCSQTKAIAQKSHSYTTKSTTSTYLKSAATCTSAAVYYYKCSRCDEAGTTTQDVYFGATIVAPIAGKVLGVKVKVGDKVTKGQTVAVIEAMKLENEVPATAEGIVKEIKVNNGDSVNNNDVLIVLG